MFWMETGSRDVQSNKRMSATTTWIKQVICKRTSYWWDFAMRSRIRIREIRPRKWDHLMKYIFSQSYLLKKKNCVGFASKFCRWRLTSTVSSFICDTGIMGPKILFIMKFVIFWYEIKNRKFGQPFKNWPPMTVRDTERYYVCKKWNKQQCKMHIRKYLWHVNHLFNDMEKYAVNVSSLVWVWLYVDCGLASEHIHSICRYYNSQ